MFGQSCSCALCVCLMISKLQRFTREILIWGKASAGNHPHIQEFMGICFTDDIPAMVSPWCDGGNLYTYLRSDQRCLSRADQLDLVSVLVGDNRYTCSSS